MRLKGRDTRPTEKRRRTKWWMPIGGSERWNCVVRVSYRVAECRWRRSSFKGGLETREGVKARGRERRGKDRGEKGRLEQLGRDGAEGSGGGWLQKQCPRSR